MVLISDDPIASSDIDMENAPPSIPAESNHGQASSLISRLFNVFAAPGDVFDEIMTGKPSMANWLVPVLIVMAVTIASFVVTFSDPALRQQIVELQERAIDQQVAAGKIKAEQAEAIKEKIASLPPWVMQLAGVIQGVASGFFGAFWWALVLWLLGKLALKSDVPFPKALEASGLTLMIFALAVLITTLLALVFGNVMARPALSAFVNEFDPTNKVHLLLGSVNLFYLWATAVLTLALARLGHVPFGKAALWLFGFWAVSRVAFVAVGLGGFVL